MGAGISTIDSADIDIRSFSINYEINAVLSSKRLAQELEEDFARDLAHRTELDPAEYLRSSAGVRFADSVARVISPLL
jgi:cardiolipin synthase